MGLQESVKEEEIMPQVNVSGVERGDEEQEADKCYTIKEQDNGR